MALTLLQRRICRLVADERKRSGESYVAGGGALNELLAGTRKSRDVDLFHDSWGPPGPLLGRDHGLDESRSFLFGCSRIIIRP